MGVIEFLHFINAVIFLQLIFYVMYKNPKSAVNRICALLCGCFAIWGMGAMVMNDPDCMAQTVKWALRIGSVGWVGFAPAFLWFILLFTNRKGFFQKKIFYFCLFAPAAVFIYKQQSDSIVSGVVDLYYGKSYIFSNSIWPYLFFAYLGLCLIPALFLCLSYAIKSGDRLKKKEAAILVTSASIAVALGVTDAIILPALKIYKFPSFAHFYALIWAIASAYAIKRYGFLSYGPAAGSGDKIIAAMMDSVILTDIGGYIIITNPAAEKLLGYKKGELLGKPFNLVTSDKGFGAGVISNSLNGQTLECIDASYVKKNGETVNVNFSNSIIRNAVGDIVGTACIARHMAAGK